MSVVSFTKHARSMDIVSVAKQIVAVNRSIEREITILRAGKQAPDDPNVFLATVGQTEGPRKDIVSRTEALSKLFYLQPEDGVDLGTQMKILGSALDEKFKENPDAFNVAGIYRVGRGFATVDWAEAVVEATAKGRPEFQTGLAASSLEL